MSEIIDIVNEELPMQLDSISWNKKLDVVAVGAYMIDPSNSEKRIGKIFLIRLKIEDNEITSHEMLQELHTSGVLDLRWEPNTGRKLVVAASESLTIFHLLEEGDKYSLQQEGTIKLSAMALYAQWMNEDSVVYSDSEGVVNVVTIDPLQITSSKNIHDNLTWVVQYSPKHKLLFAGSDEGKFTGFLLDNMEDDEKHFTKKFQVGITSIIFFGENILAVGSYDDTLRLFTIDCVDPVLLSLKKKIEFGGAPWRTLSFPGEWNISPDEHMTNEFYIVTACMRDGIHILHLNCNNWKAETITTCLEFEGFLAYGLDAKLEQYDERQKFTIISCYFDNKQLHLWKTYAPKQ